MKKISLALLLFFGISFVGMSQNAEKLLKANKWYAQGIFDGKNITLTKTSPKVSDWDVKFGDNGTMTYCAVTKTGLIDAEGKTVNPGTYHCDSYSYTYVVNGDLLHIKYPLVDYYYTVKTLPNGGIELVYTQKPAGESHN